MTGDVKNDISSTTEGDSATKGFGIYGAIGTALDGVAATVKEFKEKLADATTTLGKVGKVNAGLGAFTKFAEALSDGEITGKEVGSFVGGVIGGCPFHGNQTTSLASSASRTLCASDRTVLRRSSSIRSQVRYMLPMRALPEKRSLWRSRKCQ